MKSEFTIYVIYDRFEKEYYNKEIIGWVFGLRRGDNLLLGTRGKRNSCHP